jgi:hypothetical protein
MLSIAVTIGDVATDIMTDQQMSFEGIETLLKRATDSTLDAYNRYIINEEDLESIQEDDKQ